jgi:FixJ family two-component response regulator
MVYIVDDDSQMRSSLLLTLRCAGIRGQAFDSAEAFLDADRLPAQIPQCAVLDVRLPGLSGIGLQRRLAADQERIPLILLTGHASIPMAVEAVKEGVFDFLQKPIEHQRLLQVVQRALDEHARQQLQQQQRGDAERLVAKLSRREREVMQRLCEGQSVKQIAAGLGIGPQTAAKHRTSLFARLGIDSVAELVRLEMSLNRGEPAYHAGSATSH